MSVGNATYCNAADLNSDGDMDLFGCSWSLPTVRTYDNNGSEVFGEGVIDAAPGDPFIQPRIMAPGPRF